jgi:starch synthase (maltosyl-transferring)
MRPPIIYNLFPTLIGPPDRWVPHARRAREMGFNWLYLNPVFYPGFSGSLYAIKYTDRLHPALTPGDNRTDVEQLRPVLQQVRHVGLEVMIDLVINHTARDSPLVTEHPEWFRRGADGRVLSPFAIDPANAERVTVWGDLAEIDNRDSPDREALWRHWEELVERLVALGFTGFRGDAAYKVPASLWRRLIERAKQKRPETIFVAETLGCRLEEIEALAKAGFDYFYNSSKWWDFLEPWCLDQHARFRSVAPSISFPESHDTGRLAAESGGSESVQRQRFVFAALFSEGVQMTVGYEFGFCRQPHVIDTQPSDWETASFDLTPVIRQVNALKVRHPLLATEGVLRWAPRQVEGVTILERWSDDSGRYRGLVLVNRDPLAGRGVPVDSTGLPSGTRVFRLCVPNMPAAGTPLPDRVQLGPGEVVLLMEPA